LPLSRPEVCLLIDNLPTTATQQRVESLFARRRLAFDKLILLSQQESVQFGPPGEVGPTLSLKILFKAREDLVKMAKELVSKQSIGMDSNRL